VPDGASEPRLEDALSDPGVPEEPPPPRGAERRTVLPRVAVAAAILLAAAAGAAALFWPRPRPAPVPPPPQVVRPEPPPPPVEPTPPPEPEPAAAVAPEPVEPPSPTTSRASFEPGTVKVARSRKKGGHQLSKKDREMLDLLGRKKDGAAPAEGVEQLDLDTGRSLQPAAVERVMSDSQGAFSGCVTRTSRGAWEPSRRATLLLTVDASGAVSAAWIAEKEVSRTRLGRCLASAGRRLAFPAFEGAPVDVSVPLVLEAR